MNINKSNINAANLKMYESAKKETVKNNANKSGAGSVKAEHADKIKISSEAKSLNIADFAKAKVKADLTAEFGMDRINALKEQIKSGEYKISTMDIVMSIVSGGNV